MKNQFLIDIAQGKGIKVGFSPITPEELIEPGVIIGGVYFCTQKRNKHLLINDNLSDRLKYWALRKGLWLISKGYPVAVIYLDDADNAIRNNLPIDELLMLIEAENNIQTEEIYGS